MAPGKPPCSLCGLSCPHHLTLHPPLWDQSLRSSSRRRGLEATAANAQKTGARAGERAGKWTLRKSWRLWAYSLENIDGQGENRRSVIQLHSVPRVGEQTRPRCTAAVFESGQCAKHCARCFLLCFLFGSSQPHCEAGIRGPVLQLQK